jgi:hypothetical protein
MFKFKKFTFSIVNVEYLKRYQCFVLWWNINFCNGVLYEWYSVIRNRTVQCYYLYHFNGCEKMRFNKKNVIVLYVNGCLSEWLLNKLFSNIVIASDLCTAWNFSQKNIVVWWSGIQVLQTIPQILKLMMDFTFVSSVLSWQWSSRCS